MEHAFSQELREKLSGYFLKKFGLTISNDQADDFLDSMAELCLWSAESKSKSEVVEDKIDVAAGPAGGDALIVYLNAH